MASGKGPLTHAGKAPLWPCPSGAEPQGYVENADRRSTMNASVPLLAVMLSCAALATTACKSSTEAQNPAEPISPAASTPVLVSPTQQPRSDRVVGYWTSSSGAGITLAYTGKPESLWIQVFPKPERMDPRFDTTARWLSNDRFTYTDQNGASVEGRVSASGHSIELKGADGFTEIWRRKR